MWDLSQILGVGLEPQARTLPVVGQSEEKSVVFARHVDADRPSGRCKEDLVHPPAARPLRRQDAERPSLIGCLNECPKASESPQSLVPLALQLSALRLDPLHRLLACEAS